MQCLLLFERICLLQHGHELAPVMQGPGVVSTSDALAPDEHC